MSNLRLVKNTVDAIETGLNQKKRMSVEEFLASDLPAMQSRSGSIDSSLKNLGKKMKSVAQREIMQINNCKGLSEGKKRLYNNAAKAFQIFINTDDIRSQSEEMQSIAFDILLYYVDGLNPDISIESDAEGKTMILCKDLSDKNPCLIRYLLNTWETLSRQHVITGYDIMIAIIYNDW